MPRGKRGGEITTKLEEEEEEKSLSKAPDAQEVGDMTQNATAKEEGIAKSAADTVKKTFSAFTGLFSGGRRRRKTKKRRRKRRRKTKKRRRR